MRMTLQAGGTIESVRKSLKDQAAHLKTENPDIEPVISSLEAHTDAFLGKVSRPDDAAARFVIDCDVDIDISSSLSPTEVQAVERDRAARRADATATAENEQSSAIPAQPKPE